MSEDGSSVLFAATHGGTVTQDSRGAPVHRRAGMGRWLRHAPQGDQWTGAGAAGQTPQEPHHLPAALRATHQAEIDLIACFRESAESRFEQYRDADVLLLGSGKLLESLVATQFSSGARRVRVALTPEGPMDLGRLTVLAARARERDDQQELEVVGTGDVTGGTAVTELLAGRDMVVHVCDRPMLARALRVGQLCADAGVTCVQAVVVDGEVWVGPVAARGGLADWESAWRRLRLRDGFADLPDARVSEYLDAAACDVVAGHVALRCLRHLTGIDESDGDAVVERIDIRTFQTSRHAFLTHPLAVRARPPEPDAVRESLHWLCGLTTLSPEEVWQRACDVTDARSGVFGAAGEDDLAQAPLCITRITVNGPAGTPGGPAGTAVFGCGDSPAQARAAAALHAFASYAATCADTRLLLDADGNPLEAGEQPKSGHVWGWDMVAHSLVLVPAATAFPALWAGTRATQSPVPLSLPGVAAGCDWDEAVETGLRGLCRELIITAARRPGSRYPMADLRGDAGDQAGRYLSLLTLADEPAEAYDLTCVAGVRAFAFRGGAGTVACAVGPDRGDALAEGLRLLLLDYQARANGHAEYRLGRAARLPAGQTATVAPAARAAAGRAATIAALTAAAERLGRRPIVVPLNHDAALSSVMPFTIHVVGACAAASRGWGHL